MTREFKLIITIAIGTALAMIMFLTSGCATAKSAYYPPDCSALTTAGEQAACEKGKSDEATRVQKIRENAAYNYGKTGHYGGYTQSSYSPDRYYWPILGVGVRTWGGPSWNGYYDYDNNRGRRGPQENYGPNSPACRYANMCD